MESWEGGISNLVILNFGVNSKNRCKLHPILSNPLLEEMINDDAAVTA
jgi:hypothetical protein